MLRPWAHHFGEYLSCILDRENYLAGLDPSSQIPPNEQFYISHLLGIGRQHCEDLGLDSGGQLVRLFASLDTSTQESIKGFPVPTAGDMRGRLRTFRESLDRELRQRSFLFVPRADLYEQVDLFGAQVTTNFGKASADIKDAGTCLALRMPTAAVFHLMCVLEVALDSLSSALGLPFSQSSWQTILRDIENEVKKIGPQQPNPDPKITALRKYGENESKGPLVGSKGRTRQRYSPNPGGPSDALERTKLAAGGQG